MGSGGGCRFRGHFLENHAWCRQPGLSQLWLVQGWRFRFLSKHTSKGRKAQDVVAVSSLSEWHPPTLMAPGPLPRLCYHSEDAQDLASQSPSSQQPSSPWQERVRGPG